MQLTIEFFVRWRVNFVPNGPDRRWYKLTNHYSGVILKFDRARRGEQLIAEGGINLD
jgi:hypothetical protein